MNMNLNSCNTTSIPVENTMAKMAVYETILHFD